MRYLAVIFFAIFLVACKPATFEDGWAAVQAQDKIKAIQILTPLADKGDVRAQTGLGIIFSSKELNDPAKAFQYYKLAADQGQMWSNYQVGNAYEEGKVVEKNLGYAEQRYLKAASEGMVSAMRSLVRLYKNHNLLSYENRPIQIRRWAMAAFERGEENAAFDIEDTFHPLSPDCIAWNNAYIDIVKGKGGALPSTFQKREPDPKNKLYVLGKEQEIARLYNHIEPPQLFPWR